MYQFTMNTGLLSFSENTDPNSMYNDGAAKINTFPIFGGHKEGSIDIDVEPSPS
ncbi:MAG: hypothetical protein PVS3B3_05260 [Ktedonobacteraceae bacterium]